MEIPVGLPEQIHKLDPFIMVDPERPLFSVLYRDPRLIPFLSGFPWKQIHMDVVAYLVQEHFVNPILEESTGRSSLLLNGFHHDCHLPKTVEPIARSSLIRLPPTDLYHPNGILQNYLHAPFLEHGEEVVNPWKDRVQYLVWYPLSIGNLQSGIGELLWRCFLENAIDAVPVVIHGLDQILYEPLHGLTLRVILWVSPSLNRTICPVCHHIAERKSICCILTV